uniref:Uncharacterized protein n=1 Tax=Candidatus Kentrum sp. SD TaxID=2126332 RepID=A0A451BPC9_9GAMM|nr:MAG: hypothetical protein BECKSD772D_GA0070982_108812 [Candidatus Kentron sp. SD]
MTRMLEAVIDESGEVHLMQPLFIKGIHRALVTIFDDPPPSPFGNQRLGYRRGRSRFRRSKITFRYLEG